MTNQAHAPEDSTGDIAAALGTDFPGELDTSTAVASAAVADMSTLARGSGVLVVKRGPNAGSQFLLDRPIMSAGRHAACEIFLDDITVSRRHAEFRRDNGDYRVVDLGSLNSTYVNRAAVDSAVLADGDEIQIGNFRLVFLFGPQMR